MAEVKLAKTLKSVLAKKNMSTRALAKAANVPASTLAEWMSDRSPRDLSQVKAVAEALDVSMHYLIFGEEEIQTDTFKSDVFSGVYEISIKRVHSK